MRHDSDPDDALARDVLGRHYAMPRIGGINRIHRGMSGAAVWRVDIAADSYALRRWPSHTPDDCIQLAYRMQRCLERAGLDWFAAASGDTRGASLVRHRGSRWQLSHWIVGEPAARTDSIKLAQSARALATTHAALASQAVCEPLTSPLLVRRHGELHAWQATARPHPATEIESRIARLLPKTIAKAKLLAELFTQISLLLQPTIIDARREHFLFSGDELTGIIDFGAVAVDSPLIDLARLVGDWAGDDLVMRSVALKAYAQVRPLDSNHVALIDAIDRVGVVLACARWLRWSFEGSVEREAAEQRLTELLPRLERLTA